MKPTRALLDLDGVSLHRMATKDLPFLFELYDMGPNRLLIDLPASQEDSIAFLQQLEKQPWAMLMVAEQAGKRVGAMATGLTNLVSMNTYLLAMFVDPRSATMPLALFTRNLFWTYPLERVYVQFPLVEDTVAYGDLYESAGFQREGVMKKHQSIGGRRHDVAVFGLLREDFDRWWAARDPRLAL